MGHRGDAERCPDCGNGAWGPRSICERCGGHGEVCRLCKAPPTECICDDEWEDVEYEDRDDEGAAK